VPCAEVGANLESMLFGANHQRSFYNGNVGLVACDVQEPAAASYGVAIVFNEPVETEGYVARKCVAVPFLAGVDLKAAKASYDAKSGLAVVVPVKRPNDEEGLPVARTLVIRVKTVNAKTNSEGHVVEAELK
jgi:hypothetical protein